MINLSDLELLIIKQKAENAEQVLSRAIENAEQEKKEISDIIEKVIDEQYRREDARTRKVANNY